MVPQRMPHSLLERLKSNALKARVQIHATFTARSSGIFLIAELIIVARQT